ncbi:hypothetical protein HMPREF2534_03140 [Bacteroides thetaiotaomicron]|nr:hypothetical protein HMPREF2534_03140 [Bacteroides thetaiotaomicron]
MIFHFDFVCSAKDTTYYWLIAPPVLIIFFACLYLSAGVRRCPFLSPKVRIYFNK